MSDVLHTEPSRLSAAVSTVVAAVTVAATTAASAAVALGVVGVGVVVAGLGRRLRRHDWSASGAVLLAAGVAVGAVGVGVGVATAGDVSEILLWAPGLAGVLLVGLALVPVRPGWQRGLLKAGAALVLATVFVSGLYERAAYTTVLAGTGATVLVWDLGENAVSLSEQLGLSATTTGTEAVHATATGAVAVLAVLLGKWVPGFGLDGLSLAALVLLLGAAALLTLALHE